MRLTVGNTEFQRQLAHSGSFLFSDTPSVLVRKLRNYHLSDNGKEDFSHRKSNEAWAESVAEIFRKGRKDVS